MVPCPLGCPKLQKLVETLLSGARLRGFSKLFLDLTLFFQSEVVLGCWFWIEVLGEKALRKMSVRVKLKNLTTDIIQKGLIMLYHLFKFLVTLKSQKMCS